MEAYFIKASLSLITLYALYKIILRYELDHQLNRFIGLACILFSIALPFIQLKEVSTPSRFAGVVTAVADTTAGFQHNVTAALPERTIDIFLILYLIGAGICLLRCLSGLATLGWLYVTSPKKHRWGFTVVHLNRDMSPFTFFNALFIGTNQITDAEMETIIIHERIHRDERHSIDALLLELLTIVFWFNPAIWLFRKDIKAEHEYFADEHVLKNGINPIEYQLMLFRARTGAAIDFGNYLSNKTSLIKRFTMMTKTGTKPKGSYWRVSLLVGMMSIIVCFSAFTSQKDNFDKVATYAEGEEAMYKAIMSQIMYPKTARNENRQGAVQVSFTVNEKGEVVNIKTGAVKGGYVLKEMVVTGYRSTAEAPKEVKDVNDVLKAEAVRVVDGLGRFYPAEKNGKPVSCVLTLPIKFTLQ
jgi:hypothetical protein